jgi:hypothetical protein
MKAGLVIIGQYQLPVSQWTPHFDILLNKGINYVGYHLINYEVWFILLSHSLGKPVNLRLFSPDDDQIW